MSGRVSEETQRTIQASATFPGFRFSPTDVELISYYLHKKVVEGDDRSVELIAEVQICRHEPWDLPAKSVIQSESEWFFFSLRGRKYPNGLQSKRATALGYWKATGTERNVMAGADVIGTKRTLVFHLGRAPKGTRTEWIMHEYSMVGRSQDSLVLCRLRKNVDFHSSDSSTRASVRQQHLSGTPNNSLAAAGGKNGWVGGSEGERVGEGSKKKSSSHDSHSIDQLDSASESEQRPCTEVNPAESSNHHQGEFQDCLDDDFYAEILRDDIIKLDGLPLSAPPALPSVSSMYEAVPLYQQVHEHPDEYLVSDTRSLLTSSSQGAAIQDTKPRQQIPGLPPTISGPYAGTTREVRIKKRLPPRLPGHEEFKCYITEGFYKATKVQLVLVGLVILSLLVLGVCHHEGWQKMKKTVYSCLNKVKLH